MRGVGLVLIDKWRGRVLSFVHVVGRAQYAVKTRLVCCPCQNQEVWCAWCWIPQWIIWLQWNEYRARAALRDQVEAVIEELTEEGHPSIEWR